MVTRIVKVALGVALVVAGLPQIAASARLKDVADIEGVRGNDLIGYGIVVGLQGTGDKTGTKFTSQSTANLLERLGVRVSAEDLKLANVAAVVVTATLPPFARPGGRIDVTLSSLGDASTLQGGNLLMTPLRAADGKVYAVAQGAVSVGGFVITSETGDTAQQNFPTVGRVANGGTVERTIPFDLFSSGQVRVVLREPDFVTVTRLQLALEGTLGVGRARAIDSASVIIPLERDSAETPVELVARLQDVIVEPDSPARVVVNERTGTVIIGEHVTVSTVAVAHGNLNVTITSETQVSQPNALAEGQTEVVENQQINVGQESSKLGVIRKSVNLGDVVKGLNSLGASPRDLIAIFQALKRSGALQADLVAM